MTQPVYIIRRVYSFSVQAVTSESYTGNLVEKFFQSPEISKVIYTTILFNGST